VIQMKDYGQTKEQMRRYLMGKEEMINEIVSLCNANKDNPHCSIYWLADMIKEIVEGNSCLGDLQEASND